MNQTIKGLVKECAYCQACFNELKGFKEFTILVSSKHTKLKVNKTPCDTKEGRDFLSSNKCKEGVETTESGLQYKVLSRGNGTQAPTESDWVTANYQGSLINGTKFDNSGKRGIFKIDRIIPGLAEAFQLMTVGDKFKVFIPANLAYGEISPIPMIGANSVLIYEIELISIDINSPQAPS